MYPSKLYGIIADAIDEMVTKGLYYNLLDFEEQNQLESCIEILWDYMRGKAG